MGWCSRLAVLASAAGIAVLSLGLAPLAVAAPWPASGGPGFGISGQFGLTPALGPRGRSMSYFQLAVAPGNAVTATAVVANLANHPQTLALHPAIGVTAGNGGDAYHAVTGRCSGSACWVTGLPSRITLRAKDSESVIFTVRVPRRTAPGQYLSGITAEPATRSAPVKLGSNDSAATQAVIIHTVTVGVAVTVGDPSSLINRLSIHGVQGTAVGPAARLNIGVYNTGQTFSGGTGKASCRAAGQWHTYPVYTNTVLPGDHALIVVNAPELPEGATVPCEIQVRYDHKSQVVRWSGPVAIPRAPTGRYVPVGKGAYALVPNQSGFPRWGIALIVICLLLLAAVIFLLSRQRRPRW
ncbi:MAG: hypothetical protein JWM19_1078 [Actinomycetia bacterium]|nr:hypothetical protein [Actinomycetes bacterium]